MGLLVVKILSLSLKKDIGQWRAEREGGRSLAHEGCEVVGRVTGQWWKLLLTAQHFSSRDPTPATGLCGALWCPLDVSLW